MRHRISPQEEIVKIEIPLTFQQQLEIAVILSVALYSIICYINLNAGSYNPL